jgi:pilus assembly protein CpaC
VRRASTTLELPSGGAMVLGGLLKDDARQAIVGTPGLASLPILGTLFRSRDFQHSQSELVIFIQPMVVRPVAASKLQRPDQNFRPAGDAAAMFMGRLNRVYRTNGQPSGNGWAGRVGYIFD